MWWPIIVSTGLAACPRAWVVFYAAPRSNILGVLAGGTGSADPDRTTQRLATRRDLVLPMDA